MANVKICFMASRRGSNFKSVLDHIDLGILTGCEIALLVSNRPDCGAIKIAKEHGVDTIYLDHRGRSIYEYESELVEILKDKGVELVILAGWDWMIGRTLRSAYEWRIIAIHPSLHPSFTGLLMTAEEVHREVLKHGVKVTGCTVYYVGANVDTGPIILQEPVEVKAVEQELFLKNPDEAVKSLSHRVLMREHLLLPKAIQLYVDRRLELRKVEDAGLDRWVVIVKEDDEWRMEWNRRQSKYVKLRSYALVNEV